MIVEIRIDYDKCIRCKECVKVCSYGVLGWLGDMPIIVNPRDCAVCLDCEEKRPANAIIHKEK